MAAYDLNRAMEESAEVIAFAKQHKHPTAFFFAVRHRAHLSGLLVDRIELTSVDLAGALAKAEKRVIDVTPASPPIAGNHVAENSEAEPSDDQVQSGGEE